LSVTDAPAAPAAAADDDGDLETLLARAKRLETIVLERGGGRDAVFGGLSWAMVAAAAWLFATGALAGDAVWMGLVSAAFFAALGAVLIRRWLTPRARRLTLSPDGLEMATLLADYRLPWPRLDGFRAVPAASLLPGRGDGALIVFDIAPAPSAGERRDVLGIPLFPLGTRAGLGPVYGLPHADLIRLLEAYRAAVLRGRPPPPPETATGSLLDDELR
jgi:hypothetical protein